MSVVTPNNCYSQLQAALHENEQRFSTSVLRNQSRWTHEEEKRLINLVQNYEVVPGVKKWDRISELFGSVRTNASLELHYAQLLRQGFVPSAQSQPSRGATPQKGKKKGPAKGTVKKSMLKKMDKEAEKEEEGLELQNAQLVRQRPVPSEAGVEVEEQVEGEKQGQATNDLGAGAETEKKKKRRRTFAMGPWTVEEDLALKSAFFEYVPSKEKRKWQAISDILENIRSPDDCQARVLELGFVKDPPKDKDTGKKSS